MNLIYLNTFLFISTSEKLIFRISLRYPMRKRPITVENKLELSNIHGYFERSVTKFGNSAKIDCPKSYIGRKVYVVVV